MGGLVNDGGSVDHSVVRHVLILDNEFTLKRLAREKGRVVLRPENKAYPVIRPKWDLEIFGVVVGQFRKYR
jgi:repressor LexA